MIDKYTIQYGTNFQISEEEIFFIPSNVTAEHLLNLYWALDRIL